MTLLSAVALACGPAVAQEAPTFPIKPFVGAGLTFGGKKLVEAVMEDGSKESVSSGGFVDLRAGIEYPISGTAWAVQASVAYHVDDISASNGSFEFSRIPVEVLGMYTVNNEWRAGVGLRKATSAKTTGEGFFSGTSVALKSSIGLVVQGEYRMTPRFSLIGRVVSESYTTDDYYQDKIDANHVGFFAAYYFR